MGVRNTSQFLWLHARRMHKSNTFDAWTIHESDVEKLLVFTRSDVDNPQVEHLHRVDDSRVQSGTIPWFYDSTSWVDESSGKVGWTSRVDKSGGQVCWTSQVDKLGADLLNVQNFTQPWFLVKRIYKIILWQLAIMFEEYTKWQNFNKIPYTYLVHILFIATNTFYPPFPWYCLEKSKKTTTNIFYNKKP